MNPVRLSRAAGPGPFVESVGRHHASATLEGVAKGWPRFDGLTSRIDTLGGAAGILGAPRHEAPFSRHDRAILVGHHNDEVGLRRRDVIAGSIIAERTRRYTETCLHEVAIAFRQGEAAAHGVNYNRSKSLTLAAQV